MTNADLEAVVAATGHEHFRHLTADDQPDAGKREGYRRVVRELATRIHSTDPPPPIPLAESLRRTRLVRDCPHRSPPTCGCSGSGRCSMLGRDVALQECIECRLTHDVAEI